MMKLEGGETSSSEILNNGFFIVKYLMWYVDEPADQKNFFYWSNRNMIKISSAV